MEGVGSSILIYSRVSLWEDTEGPYFSPWWIKPSITLMHMARMTMTKSFPYAVLISIRPAQLTALLWTMKPKAKKQVRLKAFRL